MNYFEKISRFTFLFGLVLLPSFVLTGASFPYNFGKFVFFGVTICVSMIFLILSKKEIFLPSKEILIYFGTLIILSLVSTNQNISILSTFQRYSEGAIIEVIVLISCILLLSLFKNLNLHFVIFLSSIPVVIVGIFESFFQSDRIISTFGQPNFLSIFLVICILSVFKYFKTQKPFIPFLVSVPYLYLIVSSASVTSFVIFLLIFIVFIRSDKIIIPKIIGLVLLILIPVFIFFKGNILWMKLNDILRQTNISSEHTFISDSLDVRLILWEKTLQLISNPYFIIQGHGTNTFIYFFENERPTKLSETSEANLLFDKPHNYYLEIIFSYGFIGFLVFSYLIYFSLKDKKEFWLQISLILFFLTFHWLDLTLKVFMFLFITTNLNDKKIKLNSNPALIVIPIIILMNIFTRFLYDQKGRFTQKQSSHTVLKHNQ